MITSRTELKQMFGSFWNSTWKDDDLYNALLTSTEFTYDRLQSMTAELDKFLSRLTMPTSRRSSLKYTSFSELELTRRYTPLGSYLMDTGHKLDELLTNPSVWAGEAGVDSCLAIVDKPVNPTLMWVRGTHFDIVDGELRLYSDPMQDSFRQHMTTEDGETVMLIDMWYVHTEVDENYLADFFGRVIGMLTPSNPYYRKILNAVYDLLQEGATRARVAGFLGAILDTDAALVDGVASAIWNEGGRSWVAIGDTVHSCPGESREVVSVGDTLQIGDPLFDTFTVTAGRSQVDPGDFPQIVLGPAFLETPSGKALSFENAAVEVDDYRFPVGGDQDDVDAFWLSAEEQATLRGIDLHEAIIGSQHKPYVVNPFDIIRANFLATSTMFITLDISAIPDRNALKLLRYLDATVPSSTTYMLNVFATTDDEESPAASTDAAEPSYAGDATELDNIAASDYVISNEKLY